MEKERRNYEVSDPKLEAPAGANRDQHADYRANKEEEQVSGRQEEADRASRERWEKGLREGGAQRKQDEADAEQQRKEAMNERD